MLCFHSDRWCIVKTQSQDNQPVSDHQKLNVRKWTEEMCNCEDNGCVFTKIALGGHKKYFVRTSCYYSSIKCKEGSKLSYTIKGALNRSGGVNSLSRSI